MMLPERVWGEPSGFHEAVRLDFELEPSATGGLTVDASCKNVEQLEAFDRDGAADDDSTDADAEADERAAIERLAQLNLARRNAEEADEPDELQIE